MIFTTSPQTLFVQNGSTRSSSDNLEVTAGLIEGIQVLNNSSLTMNFFRGSGASGTPFQIVRPGQQASFNAGTNQVSISYSGVASSDGSIDLYWGPNQLSSLTTNSNAPSTVQTPFLASFGSSQLSGGLVGDTATVNARTISNSANITVQPGQTIYVLDAQISSVDFQRLNGSLFSYMAGSTGGLFFNARGNLSVRPGQPIPIAINTTSSPQILSFKYEANEAYVPTINLNGWVSGYVQ